MSKANLHGLSQMVNDALAMAEELVTGGEHSILPVFHNLRSAKASLNQRRLQVESYEADKTTSAEQQAATEKAAKKTASTAKAAAKAEDGGKKASDSLGTLH